MTASRLLRRTELVLWIAGVVLVGAALAATAARWHYQRQQEQALFAEPAPSRSAPVLQTRNRAPRAPAHRTAPAPLPALPAADAPPAAPTETVKPQPQKAERPAPVARPLDAGAVGRIEIPRLGVKVIVREGADDKTLARAVGLVPGSARPGEEGNMVLAGHRDSFFRPLRKIEPSDRIRVVVPPHTYEYEVQSVRVVQPHETEVLQSKGVEELTLVTCYPFRWLGPAPERFIVSAARIK